MDASHRSKGHTGLAGLVDGLVCLDHKHPTGVPVEADEFLVHKHLPQGGSNSEDELTILHLIMVGKLCEKWKRHNRAHVQSMDIHTHTVKEVEYRARQALEHVQTDRHSNAHTHREKTVMQMSTQCKHADLSLSMVMVTEFKKCTYLGS